MHTILARSYILALNMIKTTSTHYYEQIFLCACLAKFLKSDIFDSSIIISHIRHGIFLDHVVLYVKKIIDRVRTYLQN